jgi:hypothetical protein
VVVNIYLDPIHARINAVGCVAWSVVFYGQRRAARRLNGRMRLLMHFEDSNDKMRDTVLGMAVEIGVLDPADTMPDDVSVMEGNLHPPALAARTAHHRHGAFRAHRGNAVPCLASRACHRQGQAAFAGTDHDRSDQDRQLDA